MNEFIYADNAATTKIREEVLAGMLPLLGEEYGNASTLYRLGRMAHRRLEDARKEVASCLGAGPMDICFTSGGTEADNWAIKGVLHRLKREGKTRLITTAIEHGAVLNAAKAMEKEGFSVTILPVDAQGRVRVESLEEALTPDTALVSVMYANNETGVIQPIEEIGALLRQKKVLFHTDAVQAAGSLPIDVSKAKIDLLSLSAHKFHGPKGVGALYIRRGALPDNLLDGGGQERGHRSGTENVAGIVGLSIALRLACEEREEKAERLSQMRERLEKELLLIPGSQINGSGAPRLPGTLNMSFEGVDGQSLLMELDLLGVAASSGSACNSGSMTPSHVLLSMGLPYVLAHGSLRISLGRYNSEEEIPVLAEKIEETVSRVRRK